MLVERMGNLLETTCVPETKNVVFQFKWLQALKAKKINKIVHSNTAELYLKVPPFIERLWRPEDHNIPFKKVAIVWQTDLKALNWFLLQSLQF
jgi:hypothetical protein